MHRRGSQPSATTTYRPHIIGGDLPAYDIFTDETVASAHKLAFYPPRLRGSLEFSIGERKSCRRNLRICPSYMHPCNACVQARMDLPKGPWQSRSKSSYHDGPAAGCPCPCSRENDMGVNVTPILEVNSHNCPLVF